MKHGHDRHHIVGRADVDRCQVGDDVQIGGPLRIGHSLGIAGGARGVAVHHRGALGKLRPGSVGRRITDQFFIGDGTREAGVGGLFTHHHVGPDSLQLGNDRRQQCGEIGIDEDHLVFPVVDHVHQLVCEQADVESMANPSGVGGGPVQLVMSLVVPGKGAHRLPRADAQLAVQGGGQAPHPFVGFGVGGAEQRAVRLDRDDLLVGEQANCPVVEGGEKQWEVIHHMRHAAQGYRKMKPCR